jgi:hypothetical protein
MLDTRRSGATTYTAGTTYDVTDDFGALMVGGGWAVRTDSVQSPGAQVNWATDGNGNAVGQIGPRGEVLGGAVDVRAFGAVGDGVTDDTAALNNAATAAAATNRSLFLPSGVYKTTAPWVIPPEVYVLGEALSLPPGFNPSENVPFGAAIYKAHNGNAVTKLGASPNTPSAPIENVTISSHAGSFPSGNGFVIDNCATAHLINCRVFSVGGDSFVVGVTAGDVTTHCYLYNCYSNNPVGVNYRVRAKWARLFHAVSDGGTIGAYLDNAPMSQIEGFHFEGFTVAGVRLSNGTTNCVMSGRGYIGHTVAASAIGVDVTNEANVGTIIQNVHFQAAGQGVGIQLAAGAVLAKIRDCQLNNWATGISNSAVFGTSGTSVSGCEFYQVETPIYSNAGASRYINNTFLSTSGDFCIRHIAGTTGYWEGNFFDKTLDPVVTGVQGNFSGIRVKNNVGYVSRNRGVTASITAYTDISHGLAGTPVSQILLSSPSSGITSFPQIASRTSALFTLYWTGTASVQWAWEAALPCDY